MPGSDPTSREVDTALSVVAYRHEGGWRFYRGSWHTDTTARAIVRSCLILGLPPGDVVTAAMFAALVDRLAALEAGFAAGRARQALTPRKDRL
jgi:hypothetical protein